MHLHIQLLRDRNGVRRGLCRDGWDCEDRRDGAVIARHLSVTDGVDARGRLHRLGLLTSASLRIDFCYAREKG
jgi:hypothetical protein